MMDTPTTNKSHIACESWAGQNDWPTASTQRSLLNSLSSSQHLSLGASSIHRPPYYLMQASNESSLSTLSTNTHQTALQKASHVSSNVSSTSLFAGTAIPSASHIMSFTQQSPHSSSVLLAANQGINVTSQASHLPLLPSHDPYKTSFQPPLTNQGLQDMSMNLPSYGQHVNHRAQSTPQPAYEGVNVESADVAGYTHSHPPSTPQEQPGWILSSHCRGASNVSVPEAAAHPDKDPSPEGNMTPAAANATRRSAVLHQRALLLKQLSELDKLLESLPPDDSSDGQSTHTDFQSPLSLDDLSECEPPRTGGPAVKTKSRLSSDCSSLASSDELNETCEDPDSATGLKLPKKENTSGESADDTDPDYFPHSDGDFSDFLSVSSDESDHSCHSIPSEEMPHLEFPLPGKRRAKSDASLLSKTSVTPPKKTRAACQKRPSTVVLPCSNSKAQRVYDRRNYCLFCSKPMSKMSRHLESIHGEKTEVAAAFQHPKHSKDRQRIWIRLINQGNFAHNKEVLRTGKGQLAVRKRPNKAEHARDFLHCLYCRGLYMKKALGRHMRMCPEKGDNEDESQIGRKRIASLCALETLGDIGVSDGFRAVLSQMTYNDVTQVVMSDRIILQFGEQMFDQHGSDVKKHDYIRQNLRQIARLVLEAQRITPLKKLEDFFLPSSFPHVVSAVNVLAGYNPENKSYSIPSLAIKLGYNLQKACNIVEVNAAKRGDTSLAESARSFLSVYQKQWNKLISSGALSTLREVKLNTDKRVPFAQDVKCLNLHMENAHHVAEQRVRDCPSIENYTALTKITLARTILLNRRRPGEISAIQLTAFMSRRKSNEHDDVNMCASDLERSMCGFLTRIEIRGKCGRMVPVLLKPSLLSALELLVEVRGTCGVPGKNPFLFARPTALSAYNGADCLQKFVKECGAKDPEALTSAKIRKHHATMLQWMNLEDTELQGSTLCQSNGMELDDVQRDCEGRLQHARAPQGASWDQSEPSGGAAHFYHEQAHGASTGTCMTGPPISVDSGSQNKGKHKWEEAEVCAVERHLIHFIQGHKVPQKSDCLQCLEAEPQTLRNRSWKGVKDYVRNRITALKRQCVTPEALPAHSSCPGHEQPQRTGHYQQL